MAITEQEVRHIALLSRLELSEQELVRYTKILQDILSYAEKLQELSTDEVEPMHHPAGIRNVMRQQDKVGMMLSNDQALTNAPDRVGPYFRVPKVTEVS